LEIRLRAAVTVEAHGKNAGDGGLAGAMGTAEQVGVRDAVLLDGVGQSLRDVLLAHHIAEPLRPILARYDLIRHLIQDIRFAIYQSVPRGRRKRWSIANPTLKKARVTTAHAEQTTVAAFRPWRGS